MRAAALLKLVPKDLEGAIIARPELRSYQQRLNWVRAQLAHQRAVVQASALVKSPDDMQIGALQDDVGEQQEPVLARLQALGAALLEGQGKGPPPVPPLSGLPRGTRAEARVAKREVGRAPPVQKEPPAQVRDVGIAGSPGTGGPSAPPSLLTCRHKVRAKELA